MKTYLSETYIIDYSDPDIQSLAQSLSQKCRSDLEIARNCFTYVRDKIRHTGDHKEKITTCRASEVLKHKTGWCYAKSHLLAALLRANKIPAGLCYQRLHCSEYKTGSYCLHGLNAVYLKELGWYRVDARGNKKGVDAQFDPPNEKLAFVLDEEEIDIEEIYAEPLDSVVKALSQEYEKMIDNFPDL